MFADLKSARPAGPLYTECVVFGTSCIWTTLARIGTAPTFAFVFSAIDTPAVKSDRLQLRDNLHLQFARDLEANVRPFDGPVGSVWCFFAPIGFSTWIPIRYVGRELCFDCSGRRRRVALHYGEKILVENQ